MKYVFLIPFLVFPFLLPAQKADSSIVARVKESGAFLLGGSKAYGIRIELKGIYIHGQQLYFSFRVSNRSRLDYPIEFIHLYVHDKATAKRTSVQDVELTPLFSDTLSNVKAKTRKDFVIVVPQFTLPASKETMFEIFELNGGRNLKLKITNKFIFQARAL